MDPISDLFIRIKIALRAGHESVQIPYSQYKQEMAKILGKTGLVGSVEKKGKRVRKTLVVELKYRDGEPLIRDVQIISKPSRRLYASWKDMPRSRRGGIILVTTPKGVLTSEKARKEKVGGELIAEVW